MSDADTPSAPLGVDRVVYGYRLFERLRRKDVGARRCAPCDNSWVAVDRVVTGDGQMAILCQRAHACIASSVLVRDLSARDLAPLEMHVLATPEDPDGHVNVVVTGCPGVRLRALAEACSRAGQSLSHEAIWHLVARTAELRDAWARAGVEPGDTFVGFDGSLHFFPRLSGSHEAESPSFAGDEIFDTLIVEDTPDALAQLLCGRLPSPLMQLSRELALRQAGIRVHRKARPDEVPAAVQELLQGPRTSVDASAQLADLARSLFPATYRRHQQIYAELGISLEDEGRGREARVLQHRSA